MAVNKATHSPEPPEVRVAALSSRTAIIVALISAVVSIATLAKGAISPPATRQDVAEQVQDSLAKGVKDSKGRVVLTPSLPVGTIVASLLAPGQFLKAVGDPLTFNATESHWVLADARNDISGSVLFVLTGKNKTPDLRGMFLRGANDDRADGLGDPDGNRSPGSFQGDALKLHHHGRPGDVWDSGARNGTTVSGGQGLGFSWTAPFPDTSDYGEANETRPKNIATYFYLKIN